MKQSHNIYPVSLLLSSQKRLKCPHSAPPVTAADPRPVTTDSEGTSLTPTKSKVIRLVFFFLDLSKNYNKYKNCLYSFIWLKHS